MPDAMLFRAHVLSSLCDLQLADEFGEEPLTTDERRRLEDLGKILRMTLPAEVRHPWPQSARLSGPSAGPRSRSLVDVFQAALGCAECQAKSCPVKALLVQRPKTIEGKIVHLATRRPSHPPR
jgi:hypothetical protein